MKRKIAYICIIVISLICVNPVSAQFISDIKISNEKILKVDDEVYVSMDLVLDSLNLHKKRVLVVTPMITSNQYRADKVKLPSVVVAGKSKMKSIQRKLKFGQTLPFDVVDQTLEVRKNRKAQTVAYSTKLPYETWMDDASLCIEKKTSGCAGCLDREDDQLIAQNIMVEGEAPVQEEAPAPVEPEVIKPAEYHLTYIEPDVEPVKTRSDRHTATFNFIVNKFDLLRNYQDNAAKLAEVDAIVGEIQDKEYLKITEFNIAGYASPEASVSHNHMLARNRAAAFVDYLLEKFELTREQFTVDSHGEDWEGLTQAVKASDLKDKDAILDIIDRIPNPDARDAYLKRLSGGATYKTLLTEYYPPLRRTEYSIAYIVRGFDVMEAREMIKVNPKLLSLNEMYLVAHSYPKDSKEFSETMKLAERTFPNEPVAVINSAASGIEAGYFEYATDLLQKVADNPQAWNNIGYLMIQKEDMEAAEDYFRKAAAIGDATAAHNLKELQRVSKKE